MSDTLEDISQFARELALNAGRRMKEARQNAELEHQYKSGDELVTNVDLAVDAMIREAIEQRFPEHQILSEESSPNLDITALGEALWVIDPIDGTVNYAYGHYQSAVSIAFCQQGKTQYGVVYSPFTDECFEATLGKGALLNRAPIHVGKPDSLARSLVATGFPYRKDNVKQLARRLEAVLSHCRDIRRLGSAALDICWLACGRLDAYYETVSPWDLAAARLIALEAGARCGHLHPVPDGYSEDLFSEQVLMTAPSIYDALEKVLVEADQLQP